MAKQLAHKFGTEDDKLNCAFYFKTGACRHGDRCSRTHIKPNFSQTLVIPNLYIPKAGLPAENANPQTVHDADEEKEFEDFYEEVHEELGQFGRMEEMLVLENLGHHMSGNVYVKYKDEEIAEKAFAALNGRYYAGRLVTPEYSPVINFREGRCHEYDTGSCSRGGYCNYMHVRKISRHLRKTLRRRKRHSRSSRSRSRSRSRGRRRRSRSRSRSRSRGRKSSRSSRDRDRSSRDDEKDGLSKKARSNSEERRAQIASWNKDRNKSEASSSGTSEQTSTNSHPPPPTDPIGPAMPHPQ